jgi:hypothetical protein
MKDVRCGDAAFKAQNPEICAAAALDPNMKGGFGCKAPLVPDMATQTCVQPNGQAQAQGAPCTDLGCPGVAPTADGKCKDGQAPINGITCPEPKAGTEPAPAPGPGGAPTKTPKDAFVEKMCAADPNAGICTVAGALTHDEILDQCNTAGNQGEACQAFQAEIAKQKAAVPAGVELNQEIPYLQIQAEAVHQDQYRTYSKLQWVVM